MHFFLILRAFFCTSHKISWPPVFLVPTDFFSMFSGIFSDFVGTPRFFFEFFNLIFSQFFGTPDFFFRFLFSIQIFFFVTPSFFCIPSFFMLTWGGGEDTGGELGESECRSYWSLEDQYSLVYSIFLTQKILVQNSIIYCKVDFQW